MATFDLVNHWIVLLNLLINSSLGELLPILNFLLFPCFRKLWLNVCFKNWLNIENQSHNEPLSKSLAKHQIWFEFQNLIKFTYDTMTITHYWLNPSVLKYMIKTNMDTWMHNFFCCSHKLLLITQFVEVVVSQKNSHFFNWHWTDTVCTG